MKRIIALTLLCSFAAALVQAQTRPRRVGSPPSSQQQNPQTQPRPETRPQTNDPSQTARPSRPPVLGGANRDPNEQKPASTSSKDAGPEEVGEGDVVRVETTLVSIPVSVTDRDGKYIPNLTKDDFHIWEDGVEQRVAYFASTEKPFTVALVIDTSASTRFKLEEIHDAAISFVNQLRPDDRVMVVSFDDKIRVLSQPTIARRFGTLFFRLGLVPVLGFTTRWIRLSINTSIASKGAKRSCSSQTESIRPASAPRTKAQC